MTRAAFFATLAGLAVALSVPAAAPQPARAAAEARPFKPAPDVMDEVDEALARAAANGKLALIVLGANWCHDSQALVERFDDPALAKVLAANYELVLVDVGYLNRAQDVPRRFGLPVIYGTPTVLVIEPGSERVIDLNDVNKWRDANSISLKDTVAWFTAMARPEARQAPPPDPLAKDVQLLALLGQIDAFEAVQAERIRRAYAVIGPMLALEKAKRPQSFKPYWDALRDLRYGVTRDLVRLRAEARKRVTAGETGVTLSFPTYAALPWETGAAALPAAPSGR